MLLNRHRQSDRDELPRRRCCPRLSCLSHEVAATHHPQEMTQDAAGLHAIYPLPTSGNPEGTPTLAMRIGAAGDHWPRDHSQTL